MMNHTATNKTWEQEQKHWGKKEENAKGNVKPNFQREADD